MAKIETLHDIFDRDVYPADHLMVNPVNCVGVMGAGLAKEFKARYPEIYAPYKRLCDEKRLHPGMLTTWKVPRVARVIINLPTKIHWKDDSTLDIIDRSLEILQYHCAVYVAACAFDVTVDVPKLGCGLGKLSWDVVRPRIIEAFKNIDCTLGISD